MTAITPALQISRVRKQFGGLRPLRMQSLVVRPGERVAIAGLDAAAAEVLVSLLTGATLPDEGEIGVFGRATSSIRDQTDWLRSLERVGIVSPRAVLLSASTVLQNLAMPFTLSIDPVPAAVAEQAARLAAEVGVERADLDRVAGAVPPEVTVRVHLARAIALDPSLLVLEHPTVVLTADCVPALAADVAHVAGARRLTVVALTEDAGFAAALGGRCLRLRPGTGALEDVSGWWRWAARLKVRLGRDRPGRI